MDAPRLILEVRLGTRRGRKAALRPGEAVSVGRAPQAELVIPGDAQLAARHFELLWDGERGHLRDLREGGETLLDGERRAEGEVRHGSWIRAGETDFTVHLEGHTPPPRPADEDLDEDDEEDEEARAAPPPFPEEPPPPSDPALAEQRRRMKEELRRARITQAVERRMARRARLRRELSAERALPVLQAAAGAGAVHAVLDAARTPRILQILREAVEEHRSLYEGTQGLALEDAAPYLVALPASSRLLAQLVREGWGLRWGIFLEGAVPERELRRHLRRFLMVENDRGEPLYFRYYDPGALRAIWPACTRRQRAELLGPLQGFLVEGEQGEVLRLLPSGEMETIESTRSSGASG